MRHMTSNLRTCKVIASYTYDLGNSDIRRERGRVGTRTYANGVIATYTYNAANEITQIVVSNQSSVVSHDHNGNLTGAGNQTYQYDENNRLVSVSSVSLWLGSYSYDALGRRISKTTTNSTTIFLYDDARIIEERDAGNVTTATYTYGNYIDEVLTMDRAGSRYFYHQNTLWSVHALTDATGTVVERYTYDAYGTITVLDPSFLPLTSSPLAYFTFTGREFDSESGLYFYRARTYLPTHGRFLSRDPLGYVDGMNLYEYVSGRPMKSVDPRGTEWACPGFNHHKWNLNVTVSALTTQPPSFPAIPSNVIGETDIALWSHTPTLKACGLNKKECACVVAETEIRITSWYIIGQKVDIGSGTVPSQIPVEEWEKGNRQVMINEANGLKSYVNSRVGKCLSINKALCVRKELQLASVYFHSAAWRDGYERDCKQVWPAGSVNCGSYDSEKLKADNAWNALKSQESTCALIP
jgi:RHS repeat-associated protein